MQTLQIQHFSQTFVPIQALTYNSTAHPILMNQQKLEMVRHLFSLSDFWFKHDSIIYLLLHQNNIVQKIVQLFVQYQKYIIQQKYLVMRSKQDELLQKLQKCVGRIDGRPSLTERHNYRQQIASSFADTTYSRGLNEKKYNHEATNDSYRDKQPIKSENRRLKWNCDQENMYPSASINQTKSTRNSLSKNNLTDRKYLQNIGESKENVRIDVQDTKFRYMQNQRKTEGQAGRKLNNYLEADKPRRPLREYQVNLDSSKLNQSYQLEPKQTRSYLQQDSGRKYQISATPKYDEYRTGETYDKNQTPTYRRNSVSFSESFKKSSNKLGLQAKMQDDGKNNKQSFNYEAYDYLKQKKQVQPFNPNLYNKTNRNNCSIDNSNDQIQSRDSISQSKSRQLGAGSISSVIKRNNLESSKASCFEVYQGKDQKDLTIQRILDQVGSANQDTFTKLQKISELNDRINMRIKNIIQTFEAK